MTRLLAATLMAFTLWPVDENNQLLTFGDSGPTREQFVSAGYSVAADIGGFCGRNVETCATAGELAEETAIMIGQVLVAVPREGNARDNHTGFQGLDKNQ